ncbi:MULTISPECIES: hypothetical protein [Burkholderiaceae]|nr:MULTISPECIES: hypothetical protein [Burkholderiaceae]
MRGHTDMSTPLKSAAETKAEPVAAPDAIVFKKSACLEDIGKDPLNQLRGSLLRYETPMSAVGEDDWNAK